MSLHVTYTKLKFLQWFVLFCYKIKPKMPLYFGTKSRIFSHPHRISSLWRTTIPNITVIGKFWFTQSWTPTIRRLYLLLICTLNIIICQTALPVKKLSPSPAANILYAYNVRSLNHWRDTPVEICQLSRQNKTSHNLFPAFYQMPPVTELVLPLSRYRGGRTGTELKWQRAYFCRMPKCPLTYKITC